MAIDFAKSSTSYIDCGVEGLGAIINGEISISVSCWVWADSLSSSASNENVIFQVWLDSTDEMLRINVDDTGADPAIRVSCTPDTGDTTNSVISSDIFPTGEWVSVCVGVDIGNDDIFIWTNKSVSGPSVTGWTTSTFVLNSPSTSDGFGADMANLATTARHWDGRIAELAMWPSDDGSFFNSDENDAAAKALADYASAERVGIKRLGYARPILYLPMLHAAKGSDGIFLKDKYSGLEPTSGGGESLHTTHPPICYYRGYAAAELGISVGVTTLFDDTFTDTNSTSLDAHTPDVDTEGGGWTEHAGQWDIQSNTCKKASTTNANDHATADMGTPDMEVYARVKCDTNIGVIALIRYVDTNNWWEAQGGEGTELFRIFERTSGSYTQRASASVTVNANQFYDLRVEVDDTDEFVATLDGANEISYTSSTHSTGQRAGIRHPGTTNGAFDRFTVESR